ncbi:MAG TPA: transposase family protein [Trebonia sp.]
MMAAFRSRSLLDLLAQVPDPRKKRGRRHALAGLLAVGIAAVIAGRGRSPRSGSGPPAQARWP